MPMRTEYWLSEASSIKFSLARNIAKPAACHPLQIAANLAAVEPASQ
jgi:hypothetical protein